MIYRTFLAAVDRLFAAPVIRRFAWKLWYERLAQMLSVQSLRFMNYGFSGAAGEAAPLLEAADEVDRSCIQLYHHVATQVDLRDRRVLEVGCGRGGGSYYVARYLGTREMLGLDRSRNAVARCRKAYAHPGLRFAAGDAEHLPFPAASFDAVINVESSHCYGSMPRFLSEVRRVLVPGGHFLFADFRTAAAMPELAAQLRASGLAIVSERDITPDVVRGLQLDAPRRLALIKTHTPRALHELFGDFAATPGSRTYEGFAGGGLIYMSAALRKDS